jgi:hypothetical protein
MKKLTIIFMFALLFGLTACNRAPEAAIGSTPATGGSLAVDSLKSISSGVGTPKTKSLDSLDTIGKIRPSAFPQVDTAKKKIP